MQGKSISLAAFLGIAACGQGEASPPPSPLRPLATSARAPSGPSDGGVRETQAEDAGVAEAGGPHGPCPDDMVYVDTTYCPKVKPRCLKDEYNKPNHLTICNEFADEPQKCLAKERRERFCIDRYEYPNTKGGHPPVMVDWYDGMGACAALGKRLCWESEWVAACEGPEKLPFPYGRKRDATKCNIDNPWKSPDLDAVYSPKREIQDAELLRLDQSVPSGSKEGCVSGFGVYDLTGNFDEWVLAEEEIGDSKWAKLKGGAWGHVRNACRPFTTKHPPEFTYYFISFRCCADPAHDPDADAGATDPQWWAPPPVPRHPDPSGKISPGWTPKR